MKKMVCCLVFICASAIADEVTIDGVTWSYSISDDGVTILRRDDYAGNLQIPDTIAGKDVVAIDDNAFYDRKNLYSITFPQSLRKIGRYAFLGCSNFKIVTIPENVNEIGDSSFRFCYSLERIKFGSGVRHIGEYAFDQCHTLTEVKVPSSVTNIGYGAFCKCTSLTNMVLPFVGNSRGITGVIESVFANIFGVAMNDDLYAVYPYYTDSSSIQRAVPKSLRSVVITDETEIGQGAFQGLSLVESIVISNSVQRIGKTAFAECSSLKELVLPFVGAERGNSGTAESVFTHVFGSNSGDGLYANDQNYNSSSWMQRYVPISLKRVVITDDNILAYGAFDRCRYLQEIVLPQTLKEINIRSFYHCDNLKKVNLPVGITTLPEACMQQCYALEEIAIPETVSVIGINAFERCYSLRELTIPNGVVDIQRTAFQLCTNLVSVTIPVSVTNFGYNVFCSDQNIRTVKIDNIQSWCGVYFESETANPLNFAKRLIDDSGNEISELEIPNETYRIGQYAFCFCTNITKVTIPQSVAYIGTSAFANCTALTEIEMPIITLPEVEDSAFSGVNSDCTAFVYNYFNDSSVSVPGVWKNIKIAYHSPNQPIVTCDSPSFATISQSVSLSCDTEDATIYYTIDGSEPSATNGRVYKGPFDIYQTTMVKAIAVKDDWKDSAVASATFTKENGISEALNCLKVLPETQSEKGWTIDTSVSHDGVSSMKSGAIENGEMTYMQMSVKGAGRLSFWWKAKCEEPDEEEGADGYYDYCLFKVGGNEAGRLAGEDTGWRQFVTNITTTGKHVLRWEYHKDDATSFPPDCVWVDQVQWLAANATDATDHTLTTETPVPYTWLDQHGLGRLSDFEAAAKALSGKSDGYGRALTVEDDFIAGTDPTNLTSHLAAEIVMEDGQIKVKWTPDLNEDGTKSVREYKVWGKESLEDVDWTYPTNALHRFFKVTVEMP